MYNDGLNQIGRHLGKVGKDASRALKKAAPNHSVAEIARDIFDAKVPYTMHFDVPREGMSIVADLKFELPPPNIGLGKCCGDCYCSKCEKFKFDDFENQVILTQYPYIAGTVRVFDAFGNASLVEETDPEAGIVTLGYDPAADDSNIIHVCYVYKYDENCTTNEEPPTEPDVTCAEFDLFDRTESSGTWGTSTYGYEWGNLIGSGGDIYVDEGFGILETTGGADIFVWVLENTGNFVVPDSMALKTSFKIDTIPSDTNEEHEIGFYYIDDNGFYWLAFRISSLSNEGYIQMPNQSLTLIPKTDWEVNTLYSFEWYVYSDGFFELYFWDENSSKGDPLFFGDIGNSINGGHELDIESRDFRSTPLETPERIVSIGPISLCPVEGEIFETFNNRSITPASATAWGEVSSGTYIWEQSGFGTYTTGIVDGIATFDTSTSNGQSQQIINSAGPWSFDKSFRMTARVKFTASTLGASGRLIFFGQGESSIVSSAINWSSGAGGFRLGVEGNTSNRLNNAVTSPSDEWLIWVWEHDLVNSVSRAKIYKESESDPGWQVSRDPSSDSYGGDTEAFVWFTSNQSNSTSFTAEVDYIRIEEL